VLAATQRAPTVAAVSEHALKPGWETIPSYVLVPAEDQLIHPDAQRFMTRRAKAQTTLEVAASHAVILSQPKVVADFIRSSIAVGSHPDPASA
jgi:pimeloyl-ACP methyl ester carboxylesterase